MNRTSAEPTLDESLRDIAVTPLDRITAEQAADAVRDILAREAERITVDVARFASAL